MNLTPKEREVVERLRSHRVATMKLLRDELDVSHMTVVRACKKYGYHSSINHNASFYTLHDVPHFDPDGLWFHGDICFSQHDTLEKTLVAMVQNAPAGFTVAELEQRLHTRVANLLSRLSRRQVVARCFAGRQAVYLATDGLRQQKQRESRERRRQESSAHTVACQSAESPYPQDCDVVLVLQVLVQIIKSPQADAGAVAKALCASGCHITAIQVQRIFEFYSLKKKRHTGGRRPGPATRPG